MKTIFSYRLWCPRAQQLVHSVTETTTGHGQLFVPWMFTANIRGRFAVKADKLATVLHENCVDTACITETYLYESVPCEVLDFPGYIIHHNDQRVGDIVAVLVRQDILCQQMTSRESTDIETLRLLYCDRECLAVCLTLSTALYTTRRRLMTGR